MERRELSLNDPMPYVNGNTLGEQVKNRRLSDVGVSGEYEPHPAAPEEAFFTFREELPASGGAALFRAAAPFCAEPKTADGAASGTRSTHTRQAADSRSAIV